MENSLLHDGGSAYEHEDHNSAGDMELSPPPYENEKTTRAIVWADLNVPIGLEAKFLASLAKDERRNRKRYFRWLRSTPMEKWSFQERIHAQSILNMKIGVGVDCDVPRLGSDEQWVKYLDSETVHFDDNRLWQPDTEFSPKGAAEETAATLGQPTIEVVDGAAAAATSTRPDLTISPIHTVISVGPIDIEPANMAGATTTPPQALAVSNVRWVFSVSPSDGTVETAARVRPPLCRFIRPRGTLGRIVKPVTQNRHH